MMRSTTSSGLAQSEGLAAWLMSRMRALRGRGAAEQRELKLLETLSLGGKRQLMLVACGAHRYLVGGNLESVETIVCVPDPSVGAMKCSNGESL